jgi:hypothetical protein
VSARCVISYETNVPADGAPSVGEIMTRDGQLMIVAHVFRGAIPTNRHLELHALGITDEQAQQYGPRSTTEMREVLATI